MILVDTSVWVDHLRVGVSLAGQGIGYVDVHLLASTRLTPGSSPWTRDKRLLLVATHLKLASESQPG